MRYRKAKEQKIPQLPIFSKEGEVSTLGRADITMLLCFPESSCQVSVFIVFHIQPRIMTVMTLRIHGFKKLL